MSNTVKNILAKVGGTPLVEISNKLNKGGAKVLAKVEYFNPGGSVKDRIALSMVEAAEKSGVLKPGATIKVPVSSIAAASAYNASTNNYLTGGNTDWASLTSAHYLQGFDITGVNVDQGVDSKRMEQLFTRRAGTGIAYAVQGALTACLDGTTASTGVTIRAVGRHLQFSTKVILVHRGMPNRNRECAISKHVFLSAEIIDNLSFLIG